MSGCRYEALASKHPEAFATATKKLYGGTAFSTLHPEHKHKVYREVWRQGRLGHGPEVWDGGLPNPESYDLADELGM